MNRLLSASVKALSTTILMASWVVQPAQSLEVGPFTLNGFVKLEVSRASNQCVGCQTFPNEERHKPWADTIADGKPYGTRDGTLSLFQPYLGTRHFDLGQGLKVRGLLSQRWRDGKVDIPGVWYEKNLIFTHEDHGMLQVGAFPTRSWSWADFPYGTTLGIADPWASSGAGYGLLTRAIRYGTPLLDVAGGDLYLELTYDQGDANWRTQKPSLWEGVARYVKGPWMIDLIGQHAQNGQAVAWGHAPFVGVTTVPTLDANPAYRVPGNEQSIVMLMARYQFDVKTDLYGGVRFNRWSGSPGVPTGRDTNNNLIWANMFNVQTGDINVAHGATSTDFNLGVVHRFKPQWSVRAAAVHFGKASTDNPSDRGQHNSMWLGTVGLGYEIQPGWSVYGYAGMVEFARKGLAPLSMPAHTAFTGVDPRVSKNGNWAGLGMVYVF